MKEYTRSTVDRKHIEDKLPASSRTNQAIKYSWQNYTNVKCRFIFASSAVKRICFPQEHIQLTVVFFRFHLYSCATCRKYFLQDFSLKINHSRCSLKFKLCTILQYKKSYKPSFLSYWSSSRLHNYFLWAQDISLMYC